MIGKIRKYFKSKSELEEQLGHLQHQIRLMQDHIAVQKAENLSLNQQIFELERKNQITQALLDVSSNTKRY